MEKYLINIVNFLAFFNNIYSLSDPQPVLETTLGKIKGQKRCSIYGDSYYSFEKIPYAQPPLGDLRFKAPVPAEPWNETLDCTNFGNKPLQKNTYTGEIEGNEDCLFLNVYVKKLYSDKPLPVLVYIYGGAFQTGGATPDLLGPDYFMHEDVILVTLNYRLGPLGFIWFRNSTLKIPGNAGLKDQLLALRWFKNNCNNFNGDANNITLFGESAGGAAVHYLMLAKPAEGLFHKAIIMSGTVYNKWAHLPQSDYAFRLAKVNGYEGDNNDNQVFEFLNQIDGCKLVGHDLMNTEERLNGVPFVFGPTIESCIDDDCIIPVNPKEMLHNAWSNNMPIMIGGTSFEGLLHYPRLKANPNSMKIFEKQPQYLVPHEVRDRVGLDKSKEWGQQILSMYLGDNELNFDNALQFLEIYSDKMFWHGFYRTILSRLKYAKAATFLYRFDYDSPIFNFQRLKYCGPNIRGVSHADDVCYLFFRTQAWKLELDSAEYRTIRRMIGMWTAFARNSNPNCAEIAPTIWEPVEVDKPNKCLNISNNVTMIELPEAKRMAFWNSMYTKDELY